MKEPPKLKPDRSKPAFTATISLWIMLAIPGAVGALIYQEWLVLGGIMIGLIAIVLLARFIRNESQKVEAHEEHIMSLWRY
ncbi:hypothetical protein phi16_gp095 [Corynebacterium phage phi16]|uniref:hypothetical protein n=1 Tax=Corynebacterium glutamicum TaxID=1718 RepID=UPI00096665D5|nr:hypothetical protein [Corynebacterium glutamicum]APQ42598.1 hypothetical protein phi16_gp095 [Corynebacterium phage phi16]OKX80501.1 hypothetical protein AUO95_10165 [Corynebacterium glutamicum]